MNRNMAEPLAGALVLVLAVHCGPARGEAPDWNDDAIHWHDYLHGSELARASGRPALVVFYADWCPTCHAYGRIFEDPAVVEASDSFVMIRVDADAAPELNRRFAFDGTYLPRVFALGVRGEVLHGLYPAKERFRYFVGTDRASDLVRLMRAAIRTGEMATTGTHLSPRSDSIFNRVMAEPAGPGLD